MIQCAVDLTLPLEHVDYPGLKPLSITLGQCKYDLGFQVGQQIEFDNFPVDWSDELLSFTALVTKRNERIIPQGKQSVSKLTIVLEMADKEKLPGICELIRKLNSGKFKN